MQTFFLATRLWPGTTRDAGTIKRNGRRWMDAVRDQCPEVRWLEHYCMLGQYDFISIYEAPDIQTAAKVAVLTMSAGAMQAETWPAIDYESYVTLLDTIS